MRARMRPRASSTVSMAVAAFAALVLVGMRTSLVTASLCESTAVLRLASGSPVASSSCGCWACRSTGCPRMWTRRASTHPRRRRPIASRARAAPRSPRTPRSPSMESASASRGTTGMRSRCWRTLPARRTRCGRKSSCRTPPAGGWRSRPGRGRYTARDGGCGRIRGLPLRLRLSGLARRVASGTDASRRRRVRVVA